ncbi:MAG: hypothetical protein GXP14_08010 [Gammaproteobacteria bacterium]|nr:hypothetical protein [Gammaproteobacteria bacterium]
MDQSIFSGTNFVLGILLAGLLSMDDYGTYSILFSILLLWGTVHNSLLIEPFLVLGSKNYTSKISVYYVFLLKLTLWVSVISGMITVGFAYFFWGQEVLGHMVSLTLCLPLIYALWLSRKVPYVSGHMRRATQGGSLYCFIVLVGLYFLSLFGLVSVASAFYLQGGASLLAVAWLYSKYKPVIQSYRVNFDQLKVIVQHWEQGKWHLLSGLTVWVTMNLYIFILPLNGGLEESALFRIITIISFPVLHIVSAISAVMVPALSKINNHALFVSRIIKWIVLLNVFSCFYYVMLIFFGEPLIKLLFSVEYLGYGYSLHLLLGVFVSVSSMAVLLAALKVLRCTKEIFYAFFVGGLYTITVGLLSSLYWGVPGAVFGWSGASLLTAAILGFKLKEALLKRDILCS